MHNVQCYDIHDNHDDKHGKKHSVKIMHFNSSTVCNVLTMLKASWCHYSDDILYCNTLMLVGINVCVFEAKPCLWGLIPVVSSGLVNYLGHDLCLQVFIFAI